MQFTLLNCPSLLQGSARWSARYAQRDAGVVSTWQIDLPHETNFFDWASIADVKLRILYNSKGRRGDGPNRGAGGLA